MNRITGARCPKEVISTTSWRDGQATVKKILGARKVKPKIVPERVPEKTDTTHSVTSPSQEDLSEGKLSDEDDKVHHGYRLEAEKVEDEKKPHGVEEVSKLTGEYISSCNISHLLPKCANLQSHFKDVTVLAISATKKTLKNY